MYTKQKPKKPKNNSLNYTRNPLLDQRGYFMHIIWNSTSGDCWAVTRGDDHGGP